MGLIARTIYRSEKQNITVPTLKSAAEDAWKNILEKVLFDLLKSLQRRCTAVLQNRGHRIANWATTVMRNYCVFLKLVVVIKHFCLVNLFFLLYFVHIDISFSFMVRMLT